MQISLNREEQSIIDKVDDLSGNMLETVEQWSSQNSGSWNRDGLDAMRSLLKDRALALPGQTTEADLAQGETITPMGHCLLYTSPSPRDATLSRMPSSA